MVPPEVPDARINGSETAESKSSADKSASNHIVPVVELIDGERTGDENGTEKRSVEKGEFPHGRMVVRPYLVGY